jgi:hydrogenase-4 component B
MLDFIISQAGFFTLIGIFLAGALGALLFDAHDSRANIWSAVCAIVGSLYGLILAGGLFVTGTQLAFSVQSAVPLLSFTITVDYLSAFFVFLISLIAIPCSVYALGYVKHYYGTQSIGTLGFFYNIFLASMLLVVTAQNAFFFLIAWEVMSLASYFLVIYDRTKEENIKAGSLYFIMTHAGTAFIIFAFLLLYVQAGSFDFIAIKAALVDASPLLRDAVFISALIGFGTKAGIIPLHIWLPSAHPSAPSHISALMSGVMIKTGLYMIARMCFDFFGGNAPLWWGVALLVIGSVSALLGVLYALAEHDLKKLLAYHSIENIGIILLGMGSALVFLSAGMKGAALIGFVAALYHTLNHATFKALLFLGAGSVISQTHTHNIEKYGGLIRHMPATAFFFLIGSMAISALPPFNGFFSEWLTFQSLFGGLTSLSIVAQIALVGATGALALTGGLAAACFVKAFGISFLARPRSEEAAHARETGISLQIGMAFLAILTLALGLFAGPVTRFIESISLSMASFQGAVSPFAATSWSIQSQFASLSMPSIFLFGALALCATVLIVSAVSRRQKVRIGTTWDCGSDLNARMEITATGFSRSLVTVFRRILQPIQKRRVAYYDDLLHYFPKVTDVTLGLTEVYRSTLYKGIYEIVLTVSERVKRIQSGNVNTYVAYTFVALLILLITLVL